MKDGSENGLLLLCSEALSRHLFGAPVSHLHPRCIRDAKIICYVSILYFCLCLYLCLCLRLYLFGAPATCIPCVLKTAKHFFLHNLLPDVDFPVLEKDPLKDMAHGVHFHKPFCNILA